MGGLKSTELPTGCCNHSGALFVLSHTYTYTYTYTYIYIDIYTHMVPPPHEPTPGHGYMVLP